MGKMTTFILVMSGMMVLFYFAGILDSGLSLNSALLDLLLNPESIKTANFWVRTVLSIQGIATAAAIILGVFRNQPELAVMTPVALYLGNLLWDFLLVFNVIVSVAPVLAVLFFGPVLILFAITVTDWWRGRD